MTPDSFSGGKAVNDAGDCNSSWLNDLEKATKRLMSTLNKLTAPAAALLLAAFTLPGRNRICGAA
ncbi:MAG: hypothetical protein OXF73_05380 [Gammaproteobacteria bacterium]|nr:hypothetical protein [Gammaproteobacteria bacterium]